MNLSDADKTRLVLFQRAVFRLIDDCLAMDGHHKHYEGAIELTTEFANRFDVDEQRPLRIKAWCITLHCYLLGNGRHHDFFGETFDIAMTRAEAWLVQETREVADVRRGES